MTVCFSILVATIVCIFSLLWLIIQIQMCAKSVSEGLLNARFYTNGWPLFTTAICQILSPKLSDVRAET